MSTRRRRNGPHRRQARRTPRRRAGTPWSSGRILGVGIAILFAAFVAAPGARWLYRTVAAGGSPAPLTMDQARAINAAVPFADDDPQPAKRFVFEGTPAARLQAQECLATAAIYEAGDDPDGQRAVIQVILNRVRKPGFPKTVCGVVYQGAGRETGCQFSFACDGSVQRRPQHFGWKAARRSARRALAGYVFPRVGTATHYHTDWVVPYWSASLDKIAKVRTHIFYRVRRSAAATRNADDRSGASWWDAMFGQ